MINISFIFPIIISLIISAGLYYYFNTRISNLEVSIMKQNNILTNFISNIKETLATRMNIGGGSSSHPNSNDELPITGNDNNDNGDDANDDANDDDDDNDDDDNDDDDDGDDDGDDANDDDDDDDDNDNDVDDNVDEPVIVNKQEEVNEDESIIEEEHVIIDSNLNKNIRIINSTLNNANINIDKIDVSDDSDDSDDSDADNNNMSVLEIFNTNEKIHMSNELNVNKMDIEVIEDNETSENNSFNLNNYDLKKLKISELKNIALNLNLYSEQEVKKEKKVDIINKIEIFKTNNVN